jgi:hypothetical protein
MTRTLRWVALALVQISPWERAAALVDALADGGAATAVSEADSVLLVRVASGVDVEAAEDAWNAMARACQIGDASNRSRFGAANALPAAATTLRRSDAVDSLVAACMTAVANMCGDATPDGGHAENIAAALRVGVVHGVARVMQRRGAVSPDIAADACMALCRLALDGSAKQAIVDAGCIETVVSLLRTHAGVDSDDLDGQCCALLSVLADGPDRTIAARVARAGAVDVVLASMRRREASLDVVDHGCGVLAHVATSSAEDKAAVVCAGGCDALAAAMLRHPADPKLQSRACGAVHVLSNHRDAPDAFARAGGIEAVVRAIRRFGDVAEVQGSAFLALTGLVLDPVRQAAAARSGGIVAAIVALRRFADDPWVSMCACMALAGMVARNDTNQAAAVRASGIIEVVAAMRRHGDDRDVQTAGCNALSSFATANSAGTTVGQGVKIAIARAGGADAVVAAMRRFEDDANIQDNGLAVLSVVADTADDTQAVLVAAGAIDAVASAMRRRPDDEQFQVQCCASLMIMSMSRPGATAALRAGVVDVVLAAMRRYPRSSMLQNTAASVLSALADVPECKRAVVRAGGREAVTAAAHREGNPMFKYIYELTLQKLR